MVNKSLNNNLNKASKAKNDEFYTQTIDIEKELKHYKDQFHGKIVYCNCDDPYESNFFKYFAANFNALHLKKLITTSYINSPIIGGQLTLVDIAGLKPEGKEPFKIEINEVKDLNSDGAINLKDVECLLKQDANIAEPLRGNGDFRSEECIKLLKKADIIVTNPPFSLFREYVAQLIKYDKKFVIIGNKNAITYKEIFKLIKENKIWVGNTPMGVDMLFDVPKNFADELIANKKEGSSYRIVDGVVKGRSQAIWFTNFDIVKRHQDLTLYKKYNAKEYPKYDNYDAIEVAKTVDIPMDYKGVMGVPITFLDKYNPNQFKIIGSDYDVKIGLLPEIVNPNWSGKIDRAYINGKRMYARILIKRRK